MFLTEVNNVHILSDLLNSRTMIGVALSVLGNILISVALNIQKYAHNRIQARLRASSEEASLLFNGQPSDEQNIELLERSSNKKRNVNYLKSRYWWLGYILMNLGEIGNFLAYGFAPASTVAPLGTVGLISNAIIAPIFLKERFRKRDLFGIILAMAGAIMVVLTSKNTESSIPNDDFFNILFRSKVMIYISVCIGLMAFFLSLSEKYGKRFVVIDIMVVALFGGFTVLATKGVSSLLNTLKMKAFLYSSTYFLIIVLIGTGILQIKYLNQALQHFESTVVIPTQFVLFTLSAVIGSAILFDEFESFTIGQYFSFIIGCLLTFIGVYCIASEREDENESNLEVPPFLNDSSNNHLYNHQHQRNDSNLSNTLDWPLTNDSFKSNLTNIGSSNRPITNSKLTGLSSIGLAYSYGSQ